VPFHSLRARRSGKTPVVRIITPQNAHPIFLPPWQETQVINSLREVVLLVIEVGPEVRQKCVIYISSCLHQNTDDCGFCRSGEHKVDFCVIVLALDRVLRGRVDVKLLQGVGITS